MKMLTIPPVEADDPLATSIAGDGDKDSARARIFDIWDQLTPDRRRVLLARCKELAAEQGAASRRNPTSLRADRRSLARAFPACFNRPKSKAPKRPLKVGITADLIAGGVTGEDGLPLSRSRIERAVRDYCLGTKYLTALVSGAVRIDLDGNPAGVVLPVHAVNREPEEGKA